MADLDFVGRAVRVTEHDGEVLSGALLGVEQSGTVTMMLPSGATRTVPGSEIKHLRGLSTSVMPQGLDAGWSVESLRDVLAFLETERQ